MQGLFSELYPTGRRLQGSVLYALLGLTSLALPMLSAAEDVETQQIIETRQNNYRDLGGALKSIDDQLRRGKIVKTLAVRYAEQLKELADLQHAQEWFPAGTGPDSGIETEAKQEIWTRPEEFNKFRHALPAAAAKLDQLIVSDASIDAIKAQHKAVGKVCAGCHKIYREEE